MLQAIIFDLDDTLYLEKDYVLSGFQAVAKHLAKHYKLDQKTCYQFLAAHFAKQGRDKIFNHLYQAFSQQLSHKSEANCIQELVTVYRQHQPKIILETWVYKALEELKSKGIKLGLLTDGLPLMQQNKVTALMLEKHFDQIVYSWEINQPKPSTLGINYLLQKLGSKAQNTLMLGDNPIHDLEPALALSMPCIRLLTGRFTQQKSPAAITQASTLKEAFAKINKLIVNYEITHAQHQ
ncbi:HAD family hydrolase [Marinospirillum insulare]|uniref:Haloacid dehalogenase n=1 Tax=Marinospirillum insulare TaxID=217169 RepID=A0ABQ5ZZJ8_9GAMM|nr:HAD-IA family hydrolase [Marinospirillum insulare]GLR64422.1 haloacid dehalogenase [Marinospirillum insulare]